MINLQDLPAVPGTYVLHLSVLLVQRVSVGHLGQQHFPIGAYFYVGSARGAGGLRARVGRHLRGDGARHWHIDYLRAVAEVRNAFYTVTDTPAECAWSQALAQLPHAFIPVPRFGSSDCRSGCGAHLIAFSRRADNASVWRIVAPITLTPIVSLRFR
jgi:Uri superfamily endonuclease